MSRRSQPFSQRCAVSVESTKYVFMADPRRRSRRRNHVVPLRALLVGYRVARSHRSRPCLSRFPIHPLSARRAWMGRVLRHLPCRHLPGGSRSLAALAHRRWPLSGMHLSTRHTCAADHRFLALPARGPLPRLHMADRTFRLSRAAACNSMSTLSRTWHRVTNDKAGQPQHARRIISIEG